MCVVNIRSMILENIVQGNITQETTIGNYSKKCIICIKCSILLAFLQKLNIFQDFDFFNKSLFVKDAFQNKQ